MKSLAAARHSSQLTSIIKSAEAGARLVRSRQGSSMLGHLRSGMLDTFGIATSIQVEPAVPSSARGGVKGRGLSTVYYQALSAVLLSYCKETYFSQNATP